MQTKITTYTVLAILAVNVWLIGFYIAQVTVGK